MSHDAFDAETVAAAHNPQADYLTLFYDVIFHPLVTFWALEERLEAAPPQGNRLLFQALASVTLISAIAPLVHFSARSGQQNVASLIYLVPLQAIGGIWTWLFVGTVVGMTAFAFTGTSRLKTFLTLSGFATLPWLFMGPLSLLKLGIGPLGEFLCVVGGLALWLWAVLLFALSILVAYRISAERVMIILALPFAVAMIFLGWLMGFFNNISHLLPS